MTLNHYQTLVSLGLNSIPMLLKKRSSNNNKMKSIKLLSIYLFFFNSIVFCLAKPIEYSVYGKLNDRRQANDGDKVSKPSIELLRRFNQMLNREEEKASFQRSLENYLQNEVDQRAQGVYSYDPNYPLDNQQPLTLDYVESNNINDYNPEEVNNPGDINYLDRTDNGIWLDGQVIPQITPLKSEIKEDELNNFILNYLYDQYIKMYGSDSLPNDNAENDNELNFEKRRQKIVIKDDKRHEHDGRHKNVDTAITTTTTTSTTIKPVIKKVMKAINRGQKEIPLLRPAEIKSKEQWPTELELAEEESPKEFLLEKNRQVRDVLTEQLDMLKKETTMNKID